MCFEQVAAILDLEPNPAFFLSPSSHTPVHGARQSSITRHQKHLACPSLISLLWTLVLQTKSLALKLDPSVSCKKRNLDLKLLLLCVCVRFIFSSSHLSLKKNTPPKCSSNALFLKNPTPRSWFYKFPFGRCSNGPLCLKTCTSTRTRRRRCGGICIVAFGTTIFIFFVSDFFSFHFFFFCHHQHQGSCREDILFHWQQENNICLCKV